MREILHPFHKWKIIYEADGWEHLLFFKRYVRYYHLQCEGCGLIMWRTMGLKCPKCKEVNK